MLFVENIFLYNAYRQPVGEADELVPSVADTFHVVVEGEASRWAVVDPPQLALGPGEEAPVWVHFRPPRSPDTLPGSVPFAVAVASTVDPVGGAWSIEEATNRIEAEAAAGPAETRSSIRRRPTVPTKSLRLKWHDGIQERF